MEMQIWWRRFQKINKILFFFMQTKQDWNKKYEVKGWLFAATNGIFKFFGTRTEKESLEISEEIE